MHTQNVDRILNGKRNVLVLFYDFRCPECRDFVEVYRAAFAKHPLSVYFASVNAARYETLRVGDFYILFLFLWLAGWLVMNSSASTSQDIPTSVSSLLESLWRTTRSFLRRPQTVLWSG